MAHLKVCASSLANSTRMAIMVKGAFPFARTTGLSCLSDSRRHPNVVLSHYFCSKSENEEKYRFQAAEFSSNRSRDMSGQIIEAHQDLPQGTSSKQQQQDGADDSHVDSYDTRGGLNLSSVMQTTVPEPYDVQGKRSPTHLNMPGGNVQQKQKYLSDDLHRTHYQTNSKEFHTWARMTPGTRCNTFYQLTQHERGSVISFNQLTVNLSTTTPSMKDDSAPSETPPQKVSQRMKFKQTVRDYGATVMVFHISIALCSLGGFYLAVSSGLDVGHLLSKLPIDSKMVESSLATGVSTFALAYAVHKLFAPVRMALTVAAAPFIVRYLRKVGVLKPPKT